MPTEIELKLRLPPDSVTRLRRNPLLISLGVSRPITKKLYSVYYDTADFDLRRNNVALRLRRAGKHWVQTIKGGGGATAGLHRRDEWEAPVARAQPDFTKISIPALIGLFDDADLREQLHPVFITEFNRSTRKLRLSGDSEVEFCLDRGNIIAGGRTLPLCEIELELKAGSQQPLFQLALDLLHGIPFRLDNVSKAERGYELVSGNKSPPLKAKPVHLVEEMEIGEAFKAIAWDCLNHLHSNEAGMLEGRDTEYMHQMRVALRRLRSAFSLFSGPLSFSEDAFRPVAQDLKWLAGQLGLARDWDVFVTETLHDICAAFPGHPGLLALQANCEQVRLHHNRGARDAIESTRYTEFMLKLGVWLSAEARPGPLGSARDVSREPIKKFTAVLLAHRHKRLKRYGGNLKNSSVRDLHGLRIIAKKQRYAAEFFAGLYASKGAKRYIRSLASVQDILGKVNDSATIERLLDELPAAEDKSAEHEAIGIIRGWSASQGWMKKQELNNNWKSFAKTNPFWGKLET